MGVHRRLICLSALLAGALLTAGVAGAAETRDPHQYFFSPSADDFKAELADAKREGKKAIFFMFEQEDCPGCLYIRIVGPVKEAEEFLLLGEFVASGAYKTRKFAEFRQEQKKRKGS